MVKFMDISYVKDDEKNITVFLKGVIEVAETIKLRNELKKVNIDNIKSLTIDFSEVEHITSSGLRELLTLKKRLGSIHFRSVGIRDEVNRIFEMTGFSSIMNCEPKALVKNFKEMENLSFRDFLDYKVNSDYKGVVLQDSIYKCTWSDIDKGATNIALDLKRMGVGKGTHVAICSANSVNWLLTFFAIQKLGGIAVLINHKEAISKIKDIANMADVTCFCYGKILSVKNTNDFIRELTTESTIKHVYDIGVTQNFFATENQSKLNIDTRVYSDDVALMIMTSGTTGKPKAVMLTAYNIITSANNISQSIEMTNKDIGCVVSPLFHISGIGGGVFTFLVEDARIILAPSAKADVILSIIEKEKCTIFNCVPTVMFSLINYPDFTSGKVKSLRYSKLSGAPITKAQFMEIKAKIGKIHLAASYGMTEIAPITSTTYNDTIEHITETVGKPVEGVEVKVVDPYSREELPVGVSGEIIARGKNLLTGYYKLEPKLQAIDSDGWMCTGDLGCFSDDGYLHFVGRLKNLIIRGGENISPEEISSVMTEIPSVLDARVFGIPDDKMGEVVGVVICPKCKSVYNEDEIKVYVESKLAKYKWPSVYMCVESFPHLSNGKVDEIKLKKMFLKKISKG